MPQLRERIPPAQHTLTVALPSYVQKGTAIVRAQCRSLLVCAAKEVSANHRRSQICLKNMETSWREKKWAESARDLPQKWPGGQQGSGKILWCLCPHPASRPPNTMTSRTQVLWGWTSLTPFLPRPCKIQLPGAQVDFSPSILLLLSPNRESSIEFFQTVFRECQLSHH